MFLKLVALLMTTHAFAVQTNQCPEHLEVKIPEVQSFSEGFIMNQVMESNLKDVEWDAINDLRHGRIAPIAVFYYLEQIVDSRCEYKPIQLKEGLYSDLTITGTDKSPLLKMRYQKGNRSYRILAKPTSKRPYNFSGSLAQFKVFGYQRNWDERLPVQISVGKGLIE